MSKHIYFTSGEFAALCDVSKQTLLFYEKKGLIAPDHVDEVNRYRYYASHQIDHMETLMIMRKLGLSLEQIKTYMENRDIEQSVQLLQEQKNEVAMQISELQKIQEQIGQRLSLLEQAKANKNQSIKIEYRKMGYYMVEKAPSYDEHYGMIEAIGKLIRRAVAKGLRCGYSIGASVSLERLQKGEFLHIDKLNIQVNRSDSQEEISCRPAGLYAVVMHHGSYFETTKSYLPLLEYVDQAGYQICGDSYEHTLVDGFAVKDEKDYVMEIIVPVELKQ